MTKKSKPMANGRAVATVSFISTFLYVFESPAYRSLSSYARSLLLEIRALFKGNNNGRLYMGQRTAAQRMGVAKMTAIKAFAELQEKGFIRPAQVGSFDWKEARATCWVLTDLPLDKAPATKDFLLWQPKEGRSVDPERSTTWTDKAAPKIKNTGLRGSPHRSTTWTAQGYDVDRCDPERSTTWTDKADFEPPSGLPARPHIIYQGDGGPEGASDGSAEGVPGTAARGALP